MADFQLSQEHRARLVEVASLPIRRLRNSEGCELEPVVTNGSPFDVGAEIVGGGLRTKF